MAPFYPSPRLPFIPAHDPLLSLPTALFYPSPDLPAPRPVLPYPHCFPSTKTPTSAPNSRVPFEMFSIVIVRYGCNLLIGRTTASEPIGVLCQVRGQVVMRVGPPLLHRTSS
jgi:hypothetical protein